jgi:hypothetical protein
MYVFSDLPSFSALSCISSAPRPVVYSGGGGGGNGYSAYSGPAGAGARRVIYVNGPGAQQQAARAAPNLALDPIGTGNQQQFGQSQNGKLGKGKDRGDG